MTSKKRLKARPVFTFLLYFIIMFLIDYAVHLKGSNQFGDRSLTGSICYAGINALVFTLVFEFAIINNGPVYFKLGQYQQVLDELKQMGAVQRKEKGEKIYFRVPGGYWPKNRLVLKKTAFYVCVEASGKVFRHFQAFQESLATATKEDLDPGAHL